MSQDTLSLLAQISETLASVSRTQAAIVERLDALESASPAPSAPDATAVPVADVPVADAGDAEGVVTTKSWQNTYSAHKGMRAWLLSAAVGDSLTWPAGTLKRKQANAAMSRAGLRWTSTPKAWTRTDDGRVNQTAYTERRDTKARKAYTLTLRKDGSGSIARTG